MTIVALAFGAYFLRQYLMLIAMAAVLAYLFHPLYVRFERKWNAGVASALTILTALVIVIAPLSGILTMAGLQIKQMVDSVGAWISKTDMTDLGNRVLQAINDALARVPFVHVDLTPDKLQHYASSLAASMGEFALNFARSSVGGIAGGVTAALIFLYVFIALLGDGQRLVEVVKDLSPLDHEVTDVYFSKIAAMVKATVGGQFVIATVQGILAATSVYIAGIHQGYFMFVIFLTVLSFIPLGAGIVTVPMGVALIFTGNIPGGIFLILFHIFITSNADNILRPMLVPKNAYLPPALMILAVFAGLSMFGFLGIIFGPVVMIIIVTTIHLYRTVMRGVPWVDDLDVEESTEPQKTRNPIKRFGNYLASRKKAS